MFYLATEDRNFYFYETNIETMSNKNRYTGNFMKTYENLIVSIEKYRIENPIREVAFHVSRFGNSGVAIWQPTQNVVTY